MSFSFSLRGKNIKFESNFNVKNIDAIFDKEKELYLVNVNHNIYELLKSFVKKCSKVAPESELNSDTITDDIIEPFGSEIGEYILSYEGRRVKLYLKKSTKKIIDFILSIKINNVFLFKDFIFLTIYDEKFYEPFLFDPNSYNTQADIASSSEFLELKPKIWEGIKQYHASVHGENFFLQQVFMSKIMYYVDQMFLLGRPGTGKSHAAMAVALFFYDLKLNNSILGTIKKCKIIVPTKNKNEFTKLIKKMNLQNEDFFKVVSYKIFSEKIRPLCNKHIKYIKKLENEKTTFLENPLLQYEYTLYIMDEIHKSPPTSFSKSVTENMFEDKDNKTRSNDFMFKLYWYFYHNLNFCKQLLLTGTSHSNSPNESKYIMSLLHNSPKYEKKDWEDFTPEDYDKLFLNKVCFIKEYGVGAYFKQMGIPMISASGKQIDERFKVTYLKMSSYQGKKYLKQKEQQFKTKHNAKGSQSKLEDDEFDAYDIDKKEENDLDQYDDIDDSDTEMKNEKRKLSSNLDSKLSYLNFAKDPKIEKFDDIKYIKKHSIKYHEVLYLLELPKYEKRKMFFYFFHKDEKNGGVNLLAKFLKKNEYIYINSNAISGRPPADNTERFYRNTKLNPDLSKRRPGFLIFTGDKTSNFEAWIDIFNDKRNIFGDYIKFIIGTNAAGHGLNIFDVTVQIFISTVWNDMHRYQIGNRIYRAISHRYIREVLKLKKDEEIEIEVYQFCGIVDDPGDPDTNIDEKKLLTMWSKFKATIKFESELKTRTIDSVQNYEHNTRIVGNMRDDSPFEIVPNIYTKIKYVNQNSLFTFEMNSRFDDFFCLLTKKENLNYTIKAIIVKFNEYSKQFGYTEQPVFELVPYMLEFIKTCNDYINKFGNPIKIIINQNENTYIVTTIELKNKTDFTIDEFYKDLVTVSQSLSIIVSDKELYSSFEGKLIQKFKNKISEMFKDILIIKKLKSMKSDKNSEDYEKMTQYVYDKLPKEKLKKLYNIQYRFIVMYENKNFIQKYEEYVINNKNLINNFIFPSDIQNVSFISNKNEYNLLKTQKELKKKPIFPIFSEPNDKLVVFFCLTTPKHSTILDSQILNIAYGMKKTTSSLHHPQEQNYIILKETKSNNYSWSTPEIKSIEVGTIKSNLSFETAIYGYYLQQLFLKRIHRSYNKNGNRISFIVDRKQKFGKFNNNFSKSSNKFFKIDSLKVKSEYRFLVRIKPKQIQEAENDKRIKETYRQIASINDNVENGTVSYVFNIFFSFLYENTFQDLDSDDYEDIKNYYLNILKEFNNTNFNDKISDKKPSVRSKNKTVNKNLIDINKKILQEFIYNVLYSAKIFNDERKKILINIADEFNINIDVDLNLNYEVISTDIDNIESFDENYIRHLFIFTICYFEYFKITFSDKKFNDITELLINQIKTDRTLNGNTIETQIKFYIFNYFNTNRDHYKFFIFDFINMSS